MRPDLLELLVCLIAVLQALIIPDIKKLKMPAQKNMLVFVALFSLLRLAQCQTLPSKFAFFKCVTSYYCMYKKNNFLCIITKCRQVLVDFVGAALVIHDAI